MPGSVGQFSEGEIMRSQQRMRPDAGVAWVYVIVVILVMSLAVGVLVSNPGGAPNVMIGNSATQLAAQASAIRAQLNQCRLLYPTRTTAAPSQGDPLYPDATNFSYVPVSGLICPGAPSSNNSLWTASDGSYAPARVPGFTPWQYNNSTVSGAVTVSIMVQTSPDTQPNRKVLQMLTAKFGPGEFTTVKGSDGLPNTFILYLEQ